MTMRRTAWSNPEPWRTSPTATSLPAGSTTPRAICLTPGVGGKATVAGVGVKGSIRGGLSASRSVDDKGNVTNTVEPKIQAEGGAQLGKTVKVGGNITITQDSNKNPTVTGEFGIKLGPLLNVGVKVDVDKDGIKIAPTTGASDDDNSGTISSSEDDEITVNVEGNLGVVHLGLDSTVKNEDPGIKCHTPDAKDPNVANSVPTLETQGAPAKIDPLGKNQPPPVQEGLRSK